MFQFYATFKELSDACRQKKFETYKQMIPYGKKGKATFAGYSFNCHGTRRFPGYDGETCDFRIRLKKRVTKKDHRLILQHFFDHPFHEMNAAAGYDIPA